MNEQARREALAEAVTEARLRRFRTVTRAVTAAGIARGTWDKVEDAKPVKRYSLSAVEDALGWPFGYATKILNGEAEGQPPESVTPPGGIRELRRVIVEADLDEATRTWALGIVDARLEDRGEVRGA